MAIARTRKPDASRAAFAIGFTVNGTGAAQRQRTTFLSDSAGPNGSTRT